MHGALSRGSRLITPTDALGRCDKRPFSSSWLNDMTPRSCRGAGADAMSAPRAVNNCTVHVCSRPVTFLAQQRLGSMPACNHALHYAWTSAVTPQRGRSEQAVIPNVGAFVMSGSRVGELQAPRGRMTTISHQRSCAVVRRTRKTHQPATCHAAKLARVCRPAPRQRAQRATAAQQAKHARGSDER